MPLQESVQSNTKFVEHVGGGAAPDPLNMGKSIIPMPWPMPMFA
jgi:hypothetical protein